MKKILLISTIFLTALNSHAQNTTTAPVKKTVTHHTPGKGTTVDKSKDNIDDRMKGPNGEKIFIGTNGGRYYLNAKGNKTYVEYKGNKKKK